MNLAKLENQMAAIAEAVSAAQKTLQNLATESQTGNEVTKAASNSSSYLVRRKRVLEALGIHRPVSRKSWSHELGDKAIVFDAWQNGWTKDVNGKIDQYPMRTTKYGTYNLQEAIDEPRPGHTRWQHHVDLVLAGKRKAIAIFPVPKDPDAERSAGTRGWLPQYVTGTIQEDSPGNFYFHADKVVPI